MAAKQTATNRRCVQAPFETAWGAGTVTVSGGRLVGVELPDRAARDPGPIEAAAAGGVGRAAAPPEARDLEVARQWAAALEAYFRGERLSWTAEEIPLDDLALGEFERRVYAALLQVPAGVTVSYGTLAELAGYPRAARAVGNAMAANPIPIVIPCHRVIRSDGSMGRYGRDPSWKVVLLDHEVAHTQEHRP